MTIKTTLPTIKDITNIYLYGQENAPTEEELNISELVVPEGKRIYKDK